MSAEGQAFVVFVVGEGLGARGFEGGQQSALGDLTSQVAFVDGVETIARPVFWHPAKDVEPSF